MWNLFFVWHKLKFPCEQLFNLQTLLPLPRETWREGSPATELLLCTPVSGMPFCPHSLLIEATRSYGLRTLPSFQAKPGWALAQHEPSQRGRGNRRTGKCTGLAMSPQQQHWACHRGQWGLGPAQDTCETVKSASCVHFTHGRACPREACGAAEGVTPQDRTGVAAGPGDFGSVTHYSPKSEWAPGLALWRTQPWCRACRGQA